MLRVQYGPYAIFYLGEITQKECNMGAQRSSLGCTQGQLHTQSGST